MFSFLILISLIPIALALAARWWFGTRILADEGNRACRCDLALWFEPPADGTSVQRAETTAAEFGRQLRIKALADWRESDPKAAASREGSRRFGQAVPPLSVLVAVFALLVGKIPAMAAIAIVLGATAIAALLGVLTLPPELTAIARAAHRIRKTRSLPRRDDEEAVIRCASAHAWDLSAPPVIRWLQR